MPGSAQACLAGLLSFLLALPPPAAAAPPPPPEAAFSLPGGPGDRAFVPLSEIPFLFPQKSAGRLPLAALHKDGKGSPYLFYADDPGRPAQDALAALLEDPTVVPAFSGDPSTDARLPLRPFSQRFPGAALLLQQAGLLPAGPAVLLAAVDRPALFPEDPVLLRQEQTLRMDVLHDNNAFLAAVDTLERALEPVEERTLGLALWALERRRAAFEDGLLSFADYGRSLAEALNQKYFPPPSPRQDASPDKLWKLLRRWESRVFEDPALPPAQKKLLDLMADLRRLRRRAADRGTDAAPLPSDDLHARAQALARLVDLPSPTAPREWPRWTGGLAAREILARRRAEAVLKNIDRAPRAIFIAEPAFLPFLEQAARKAGRPFYSLFAPAAREGQAPGEDALPQALWDLAARDLRTAKSPGERASAALFAGTLLLLTALQRPSPPSAAAVRRNAAALGRAAGLGLKVDARLHRRTLRRLRLTVEADGLPPARFSLSAAAGRPDPSFTPLGEWTTDARRWRLGWRAEPRPGGPRLWVKAQARAMRLATRNFFRLQKGSTLLAGVWMAGGVAISAAAGAASAALVAAWMVAGLLVLAVVVLTGKDARSTWKESFQQWKAKFLKKFHSS